MWRTKLSAGWIVQFRITKQTLEAHNYVFYFAQLLMLAQTRVRENNKNSRALCSETTS